MSVTSEYSVRAEILTVPGHALCSWEQDMVRGGNWKSGYTAASSSHIVAAITVSVIRGR
jgi:hypothetical protein